MANRPNARLPKEVNRILLVKNLPYKITAEDMYEIFGKFGAIRQIRIGNKNETRGTAFVVYEDIYDAKNAADHLSGFNVMGRYLTVLYFQPAKAAKKMDLEQKKKEIEALREQLDESK
jgi:pre-mRNA branch site protein p14